MVTSQVLAVCIFLAMFILIVLETFERHTTTLLCGGLMLIVVFGLCLHSMDAIWHTLNLEAFFHTDFWFQSANAHESTAGINWETIVFIAGMMIMVEGMGESGFFRWLCLGIAKGVNYRTGAIFVTFMVMSALLAMFIDSITVILFLAAVTLELAKLLKFQPIPLIIAEIFCANLGGSATMCGDPPNIIIGTSLGYSFFDFINNTGLIALISLLFVVLYFCICFRKYMKQDRSKLDIVHFPAPASAIHSKAEFALSLTIFLVAVVLLVTHSMTGLTVSTIGVFVTMATLLGARKKAWLLIKKVDYKTLLFFIGLFVVVGGLEQTGILAMIANLIAAISGDHAILLVLIVLWLSAVASAFVDNIPFAATMLPVIKSLEVTSGVPLATLAWSLSIGTDIGGSATPIGASANVVGISAAAQEGHFIGWGKFCKYSAPATILVLILSSIYLCVRYF